MCRLGSPSPECEATIGSLGLLPEDNTLRYVRGRTLAHTHTHKHTHMQVKFMRLQKYADFKYGGRVRKF